jgi:Fe-coproporphyrin III synthase
MRKLYGTVIVTYRCNARCNMCDCYKDPTRPQDEITLDTIRKLPEMAFTNITGGEPFIRQDLPEIVRALLPKTDRIVISTNGYFTDRIIALCKEFPSVGIRISIEGLQATNDAIRGIPDGFNRGYGTLQTLVEMGHPDVGFGMTVQDRNHHDLLPLYRLSEKLNMEFATATLHNSFYFRKTDNKIDDKEGVSRSFEALISEMLRSKSPKQWFRAYFNHGLVNYIYGQKRLLPCEMSDDGFFIDPFGDVLPCNGMAEKASMGNLRDKDWDTLWNSERARAVRAQVHHCQRNCWMIGSASPAMHKRVLVPAVWIVKHKLRGNRYRLEENAFFRQARAQTKPLRIAMFGHKRVPGREGGVEVVVEELGKRLTADGHSVTLYNRRKKGLPAPETVDGMRIITVPTINRKNLDAIIASAGAALRTAIGSYDVVHIHAEGPCAMLWLPKLFGKRVVATIHGLDWQRAKWGGFATRFLLFGERMAVKRADALIVLSKQMQRYFHDTYGRETLYIPNGVRLPVHAAAGLLQEQWGLKENQYVLFVARIVPEKGLHYLLNAFRGLQTQLRLVIAGDSSHTDAYMARIRALAAKDNRVVLTGFVQGNALAALYSNARLYVLPSDVEGMPLTLLEAMSYGCVCLVSDIPENTEVLVGNHNTVFAHGDETALKAALETCLQAPPPTAEQRALKAQSTAEAFDWDRIARETVALAYRS